jgi:hypothetical protein
VARKLVLALIAAAVLAAAAEATIVVQRSIAGVSIALSQKKVRAILGKPRRVIHARNAFGPYVEYRYRRLVLDFQGGNPLSSISTTRRSERTARGIGVGSTRRQVRLKVHGVRCGQKVCTVGRLLPGRIVTSFYLRKGVVWRVGIARVLD